MIVRSQLVEARKDMSLGEDGHYRYGYRQLGYAAVRFEDSCVGGGILRKMFYDDPVNRMQYWHVILSITITNPNNTRWRPGH